MNDMPSILPQRSARLTHDQLEAAKQRAVELRAAAIGDAIESALQFARLPLLVVRQWLQRHAHKLGSQQNGGAPCRS